LLWYCKIKDLFYQSICYFLRLLKNSSGRHLRWHACLKCPSSSGFLSDFIACQTICLNPSPKSFSQSGKIVNLWPGRIPGEGQVQLRQGYKEELQSSILCLCVCLAVVSTWLHPFDQEKLPCEDFLSLVCLFSAPECY
jgi:hypothetical protein